MTALLSRIVCCGLAGAGCTYVSRLWIKKLQAQRGLSYDLSRKSELLLLAAMTLSGAAAGALSDQVHTLFCAMALLIIGATVSVIDSSHRIIPNPTVLAVILLKLISGIPVLSGPTSNPPLEVGRSLAGLAACFAIFALPGLFGKNVGAGDIKLAAAMGFLLGIDKALLGIALMGLLVLAYTLYQNQLPFLNFIKSSIPMGPFIAAGMFAAYIGADYIM